MLHVYGLDTYEKNDFITFKEEGTIEYTHIFNTAFVLASRLPLIKITLPCAIHVYIILTADN